MSLTEFDQELYDRNRRQEGFEDGFEQGEYSGIEKNKIETARNALARGLAPTLIAEITGLSVMDVQALADNTPVKTVHGL